MEYVSGTVQQRQANNNYITVPINSTIYIEIEHLHLTVAITTVNSSKHTMFRVRSETGKLPDKLNQPQCFNQLKLTILD